MQRFYKEFIPVFHTFVIGLHTHTHTLADADLWEITKLARKLLLMLLFC
jgi:hypothetical protein